MAEQSAKRGPRGRGEGSIALDKRTGLWVGRIELPAHDTDENGDLIRRRKVIRRKDKDELIRELNKLRSRLERSGDIPTASQTAATWFEYWMREIVPRDRRPATVTSYRSMVNAHIVPGLGKVRLDKVTPEHVRRVLVLMQRAGKSSTYRRNAFSTMSAAFKIAEREGRMPRNPCDLMDAPLKAVPQLEVLTPEEATRLVGSFNESPEAYLWATFILTGARRGELLGLEWDRVTDELDLSWQLQRLTWSHGCGDAPNRGTPWLCGFKRPAACTSRHLQVPDGYEYRHIDGGLYWTRPKSRAGWRVIPLVDPLRSILQRWRDTAPTNPHGLVFTFNGSPIDPDQATAAWPTVLKAAGIDKHVRLHDLRHTAVDLLYLAGVPEDLVQEIVGHSNRAMSRAYKSKGNRDRLIAAMNQFSRALGYEQPALES